MGVTGRIPSLATDRNTPFPVTGCMRALIRSTATLRPMPTRVAALFNVPLLRRVAFHARRISSQVDRHFFATLLTAIAAFVLVATLLVALFEGKFTIGGIGNTLYWAVTTVIGSGDASYVTSLGGFVVSWLLAVVVAESLGTLAPLRLQHE